MAAARAVVLPGVGAFDDCVNAMQRQDLPEAIRDFIRSGRPFLGICVGYQALFERSEEFNSCAAGLGIFGGKVVRFADQPGLKIPQIGWNQIEIARPGLPALPRHCLRQLRLFCPQLSSPSRWTRPSSPLGQPTDGPSRPRSGGTTFLPPSFIRRRARPSACNCSGISSPWPGEKTGLVFGRMSVMVRESLTVKLPTRQ
jgi:hypothetical protein